MEIPPQHYPIRTTVGGPTQRGRSPGLLGTWASGWRASKSFYPKRPLILGPERCAYVQLDQVEKGLAPRPDVHPAWVLVSESLRSASLLAPCRLLLYSPPADCMETRVPGACRVAGLGQQAGVLTQPGVKALVLVEESGTVVVKEVGSASLHCRHPLQKGGVSELDL